MLPVSLLALIQQPQRQVFSRFGVSSLWKLHLCQTKQDLLACWRLFHLKMSTVFFFFHLVAPASHSEKNQDTETIKDFPESQSKIERLIP